MPAARVGERVRVPMPAWASSEGSTPALRGMDPEMPAGVLESVMVPVGGKTGTGASMVHCA